MCTWKFREKITKIQMSLLKINFFLHLGGSGERDSFDNHINVKTFVMIKAIGLACNHFVMVTVQKCAGLLWWTKPNCTTFSLFGRLINLVPTTCTLHFLLALFSQKIPNMSFWPRYMWTWPSGKLQGKSVQVYFF